MTTREREEIERAKALLKQAAARLNDLCLSTEEATRAFKKMGEALSRQQSATGVFEGEG